jgi:hypothetical protein
MIPESSDLAPCRNDHCLAQATVKLPEHVWGIAKPSAAEETNHRHCRLLRLAASGHAAAAPPISLMNVRRLIRSARLRGRTAAVGR